MSDRKHLLAEANTPLETLQTSYIKYKNVITIITVLLLILLGCGIVAVAIYNVITHGRETPDMLIVGCNTWTGTYFDELILTLQAIHPDLLSSLLQ
jgi:hypothetical protein